MTVTQRFYLLPFPVRDRSDVLRAVRHVVRQGESENAVNYVSRRARELGCADTLPLHWHDAVAPWSIELTGLDGQIRRYAERLGVSDAKLKAVYLRGVRDFKATELDLGTAGMWGLARLQRFITACNNTNPDLTEDSDLLYDEVPDEVVDFDLGMELSLEGGQKALEILRATPAELSTIFHPGEPTSMEFDQATNTLTVQGRIGPDYWTYTLNAETARETLELHD